MIRCVFAIPGDINTPTGGYAYARKIMPFLAQDFALKLCQLPPRFPFPTSADIDATGAAIEAVDENGGVFLFDGLAFGALPVDVLKRVKGAIVVLLHHPLALEEGLTPFQREALLVSEKAALNFARHLIVTSPDTAKTVGELFDIDAHRITVAEPGVSHHDKAKGSALGSPLHIVSVGALTPRKGFDILLAALKEVQALNWRASIAGALDRAPETATKIQDLIVTFGLKERVQLLGPLSENSIAGLYDTADVFALATRYEGYGMVFAEAMSHGLPIVASGEGAVKQTIPPQAGLYCKTGDVAAFAAALEQMLTDSHLRKTKANAAWHYAQSLPTWEATAKILTDVIRKAAT